MLSLLLFALVEKKESNDVFPTPKVRDTILHRLANHSAVILIKKDMYIYGSMHLVRPDPQAAPYHARNADVFKID
jgi:hypothetical protein